jgi:hypothetical protein
MTTAEIFNYAYAYAYDQIDHARAELTAVSKQTTYATSVQADPPSAFPTVGLSQLFVSEITVSQVVLK